MYHLHLYAAQVFYQSSLVHLISRSKLRKVKDKGEPKEIKFKGIKNPNLSHFQRIKMNNKPVPEDSFMSLKG